MTVAAVENAEKARATLMQNRDHWFPELNDAAIFDDIVALDPDALLAAAGLERDEAALLHGGPPCTPFSKSGYWLAYKRAGADPKASLVDNYVDVLERVRPMSFLMENVYGLAYGNQNRAVFERFLARVADAGYACDWKILLAADFGVPQLRQRLICVGIRADVLDVPAAFWRFPWPRETHVGPHETRRAVDDGRQPHVTAGAAFEGLNDLNNPPESEEVVTGRYAEDLAAIPPGDNYLFLTAHRGHPRPKFEWRTRYWTFLLKLSPERPASTIQGQPGPWVGPFHWENRRLRLGELKRLMEFPDEFEVIGSRRDAQLQLGNAVPPRLAYVVALGIRAELERLGAITSQALEAA